MSSAPVAISGGGIDELPAIDQVMATAFDPLFGEAWNKAQCLATFAMPGYALRVARQDGVIVGFSIVRWVADESELLLLAVAPQSRGQGIGAALLADWIDFARARHAKRFFLEMRTDNPAMALYSRFGFTVSAKRAHYYRGKDDVLRDAVTMQFLLPNA